MKFSIITPSYNQGRFITDSLQSVKIQLNAEKNTDASIQDFSVEHLVMDGGSTDGTVAMLEIWLQNAGKLQFRNPEPRTPDAGHPSASQDFSVSQFGENLRFHFVSEADAGQTDAINKGLNLATGDILAYLCSDDLYEPGALAAVAEIFQKNPEVDVVYGDYYFLEGDSGWKRLKEAGPFSRVRLLGDNFLGQPAVFWRRRVYERYGALDGRLKFCMDHEYWLRISGETKWFYLEQALAVCRLHGSAKTSSQLAPAWWETARMVKQYGQGCRFFWKAVAMQCVGQWLYQGKRMVFERVGKWRWGR